MVDLDTDKSVEILIEFMNKLFKDDELSNVYEPYLNFDWYSKKKLNRKWKNFFYSLRSDIIE